MTPVNAEGSVGSVSHAPPDGRRKAVLFCPRCGHENPVDGDWVVTVRRAGSELRCPDCRELLTRRYVAAKERSVTGR